VGGIGVSLADPAARGRGDALASSGTARDRFLLVAAEAAGTLVEEWAGLATEAAEDNSFFLPDFALPAMRHLGGDTVRLGTVRASDGRLIAVAPVRQTRLGRIERAMTVWSHNYGPLGVPLISRGDLDPAVAAFLDGAAPAQSRVSLVLPDLPLDGPVAAAFVKAARQAGRPVNTISPHWRAMLLRPAAGPVDLRAALPTRRRKEYGRLRRRLDDLGSVTIETAYGASLVAARFEEFLTLEASGWKGRVGTALAARPPSAEFARLVMRNRAENGMARTVSLRLDDRPVAIVVCFVAGATAYSWKIAYDERYSAYSPGAQLMLEAGERLFSDVAVKRIDSLADADHPMIDHLWQDRLAIGTLVIGPPGGGVRHRIGLALAKAEVEAWDVARGVRARLRKGHAARAVKDRRSMEGLSGRAG
jgi:CelD/BcsL family acetyltransferase involved in cellulose biosynthesis